MEKNVDRLHASLRYSRDDIETAIKNLLDFGFAVIPNVVPKIACASAVKELNRLEAIRETEMMRVCDQNDKEKVGPMPLSKWDDYPLIKSRGQVFLRDTFLQRPDMFLPYINLPPVIEVVSTILGDSPTIDGRQIILDAFGASKSLLELDKGETRYAPHVDTFMVTSFPKFTTQVIACICFDEFTSTNGATKIWPGSHKSGIAVHKEARFKDRDIPGHVTLIAPQGSIGFFLGQTWHQIGSNTDGRSRWGNLISYNRWWIKPQTSFTQCGEEIFNMANSQQRALLGFTSIPPPSRRVRAKILIEEKDVPSSYTSAIRI